MRTDSNNNEIWVLPSHSNKDYERLLYSESGTFYIDNEGVVQRFEPAADNPFVEEETEKEALYTYTTYRSIRTFVVPEGVKGFDRGFMGVTRVIERFDLSDGQVREY